MNQLFVDLFGIHEFPWRNAIVICYAVPAVITGITAAVRWETFGRDGESYCYFLPAEKASQWALFGPLALVSSANLYFLVQVILNINRIYGNSRRKASLESCSSSAYTPPGENLVELHPNRVLLQAGGSFFCVLGLQWLVLFVNFSVSSQRFLEVILAANLCFHAFSLFGFHTAADPAVRQAVHAWLSGQQLSTINGAFFSVKDIIPESGTVESRLRSLPPLYTLRADALTRKRDCGEAKPVLAQCTDKVTGRASAEHPVVESHAIKFRKEKTASKNKQRKEVLLPRPTSSFDTSWKADQDDVLMNADLRDFEPVRAAQADTCLSRVESTIWVHEDGLGADPEIIVTCSEVHDIVLEVFDGLSAAAIQNSQGTKPDVYIDITEQLLPPVQAPITSRGAPDDDTARETGDGGMYLHVASMLGSIALLGSSPGAALDATTTPQSMDMTRPKAIAILGQIKPAGEQVLQVNELDIAPRKEVGYCCCMPPLVSTLACHI